PAPAPQRTLPSGCASQSAARRGGPSSLSARSNADTRGVTGCAKMLRIIDALIGVFASSAPATGTHAPSATSTQISTATPSRTMTTSRLLVDRERVAPVLELVLDLDGLARQLAELPHGDQARAELVGERTTEDEPARLDGDDDVHALFLVSACEYIDHVAERRTVLQEGGNVLEEDPFGRKILDVADLRPELGDVHRAPILLAPCRSAQDARRRQSVREAGTVTRSGVIRHATDARLTRSLPLNSPISRQRRRKELGLASNLLSGAAKGW